MAIYRHIDLKKYMNLKYENGFFIKSTLIFVFALFFYYYNNLYTNIFSLIVVCIYSFITNKDFLKSSFNTVKSKIKHS